MDLKTILKPALLSDSKCKEPWRRGRHEMYVTGGGTLYCRACGHELMTAAAEEHFKAAKTGDYFLHFKGGKYVIVDTDIHDHNGVPVVFYQSLTTGGKYVRPAGEFFEFIQRDGRTFRRFAPITKEQV